MDHDRDPPAANVLTTRILHPQWEAPPGFAALTTPIHHASTVVFPNLAEMRARTWERDDSYTYGLHGTPTTMTLEHKLAQIEGGEFCVLSPSGLAAITLVDMALLKQGDEVLLPANVYAPNREFARAMLAHWGIATRLYDPLVGADLADLITPATRLVWIEAPGSITMEVPDVPALVAAVRAVNDTRLRDEQAGAGRIVTAVDNTWSAGIAFKPFEFGIDIAMQALTKYQSGGSDILMGALITRDHELHLKLKFAHMRLGHGVGADDAYLVLRGLQTLALRFAQHDAAGRSVARWCTEQPEITQVLHPALPSCPGHASWQRDFRGAGGLFSVVFDPAIPIERIERFVESLRLFPLGFSWGGATSLVMLYQAGRTPTFDQGRGTLVRLNIGLEAPADLIADLTQAMRALRSC
jgi:cystathionine beta-lyase